MNNLLRTLTESHVRAAHSNTDLKLLLSAVKDSRSHDASKLADAFYDSLEGLLLDLRMDNHDAEAFLKPVSKVDAPDYYEVISNPMDLQTMLKRVKQKQYKSKREFKDDLDLIWQNCFTYNATENHPLRQCAKRLKTKAERLLKYITDYKERADPVIPPEVSAIHAAPPRTNGVVVNGHSRTRSPAVYKSPSPGKAYVTPTASRKSRKDVPFAESSAIIRTPEGMAKFARLDRELAQRETAVSQPDRGTPSLEEQLTEYALLSDEDGDPEVSFSTVDGETGAKRKLNGFIDNRPRKRVRVSNAEKDLVDLWWDAVQSDELLGNGLPVLVHSSSDPTPDTAACNDPRRGVTRRMKKRKKANAQNTTLLYYMNNNIRTLRRVRTTHAKFAALNQTQNTEEGVVAPPPPPPEPALDEIDDVIDEQPWKPVGSGTEIGEKNADDCLHWAGSKILEHAGFQGTSKVALDVLAGVTSEYLLNVGRTIRFLCDKYAKKMTPEEIVLHTLFESGTTRIYELERYIKDDVIRYGGRLSELEKKLTNAYREATTEEAWDDETLFQNAEDEEEDGQFVMGNFAESFGEDFLGLRELGIAAEFGLTSLSVPKKLLKGKNKQGQDAGPSAAKPSEPPPPFPPPPPFVPLDSKTVENQIGLLKPYYQQRLSSLSSTSPPPTHPPGAAPGTMPPPPPPAVPISSVDGPPIVLPDDAPSPSHTKIGPLGQVMKGAPAASAPKKKSKAKQAGPAAMPGLAVAPSEGGIEVLQQQDFTVSSPIAATDMQKKGKAPSSAGGSSNKKKPPPKGPDAFPQVVMASA